MFGLVWNCVVWFTYGGGVYFIVYISICCDHILEGKFMWLSVLIMITHVKLYA